MSRSNDPVPVETRLQIVLAVMSGEIAIAEAARRHGVSTDGVIERFFGTLKYEHLYRAPIDDGGALAMETARFRDIYNRIRPHQSLGDRTPRDAYLGITGGASV